MKQQTHSTMPRARPSAGAEQRGKERDQRQRGIPAPGRGLTHPTERSLSRGTGMDSPAGRPCGALGSLWDLQQDTWASLPKPTVKTPPSPILSQGSKPLWQVGLPPVSLSLTMPDGKEFPDLEGHTVPPRALRTRDTHTHPSAGVQEAPQASTHARAPGRGENTQKTPARKLSTRQAGESCKPSGMGGSENGL